MKVGVEALKRKKAEEGASPVDFDTLIIILAEIEKNLRNLSGVGRHNRQLKEISDALTGDRLKAGQIVLQFSEVIHVAMGLEDLGSMQRFLRAYHEELAKHYPVIPLIEDDTLEK